MKTVLVIIVVAVLILFVSIGENVVMNVHEENTSLVTDPLVLYIIENHTSTVHPYHPSTFLVKLEELDSLIQQDGLYWTAHGLVNYILRNSHSALADFEKALAFFEQMTFTEAVESIVFKAKADCLYYRSRILYDFEEYSLSLEVMQELFQNDDLASFYVKPQLRYMLVLCHYQLSQYESALSQCQAILLEGFPFIDDDPFHYQYYNSSAQFALVFRGLGPYDRWISDYNRALQKDPEDSGARLERALLFRDVGLAQIALSECEMVIEQLGTEGELLKRQPSVEQRMHWYELFAKTKAVVATVYLRIPANLNSGTGNN